MQNATTYEIARTYTSKPSFIVPLAISWAVIFLALIITGCVVKTKNKYGNSTRTPMIMAPNFWIMIIIFAFQLLFLASIAFPWWMLFLR